MHVIVGQGQLDSILHATPEDRRGFIEEAAGVLKHRKRKEKALRKLDATEGNLTRLSDLLSEIRRQLKPLGRQAEVARRAAVVQADARDARARLLADDLVTARTALEQELADESVLLERRAEVEAAVAQARAGRGRARGRRSARTCPRWRPPRRPGSRCPGCASGCGHRGPRGRAGPQRPRRLRADGADRPRPRAAGGRGRAGPRPGARDRRRGRPRPYGARGRPSPPASRPSRPHVEEDRRVAGLLRAAADRREGLARLHGQVNALKSRAAAADEEVGRLAAAREEAVARAERAQRDFTSLESRIAGLDAGEEGLDAEHEGAAAALGDIEERLAKTRDEAQTAERERTGLAARKEALELGLNRKDGAGALLAASDSVSGLLGLRRGAAHRAPRLRGRRRRARWAPRPTRSPSSTSTPPSAPSSTSRPRTSAAPGSCWAAGDRRRRPPGPGCPADVGYAVDVVECPAALRPALSRLLFKVAVVDDLDAARAPGRRPARRRRGDPRRRPARRALRVRRLVARSRA